MILWSALSLPIALATDEPTFSVERGLYDAAFTLEISPADPADTLLVSTDGSTPSAAYTGPLSVDGTTLVRAVELSPDGEASRTVTHTYLFVADVLASADLSAVITGDPTYGPIIDETLRALPTISIVTDALTPSESAASVEWIDPDGPDALINGGAKRAGTTSLVYPKNHIRLSFNSGYEGDLDLDLYGDQTGGLPPVDHFEDLNLRSGGHDSVFYLGDRGQYLRNRWMDESQLAMGHPVPHGRFAHVYVNGAYVGVYHVRERFDRDFLASYLGGDDDDYEIINGGTATQGDGGEWATIVALSGDYQAVQEHIHATNFLDYMILNFYAGNAWDWSYNHNWMAGGPSEPGRARYVFHSSDNDICIYYDWTVNILDNPGPSYVWYYLLNEGDPDFLALLADRIHANLEGDGPLTAEAAGERYAWLAGQLEDAVVAESARWGGGTWDRDGEWVSERDHMLDEYFPNRTAEVLRQMRAAGWYPLGAPELDVEAGLVPAGTSVQVTIPDGADATLWVSIDGQDPREPGGATRASATGPDTVQTFIIEHSMMIQARLLDGDTWGPVQSAFYEVDETPPLVLNEWNAVASDETLRDGGQDAALGRIEGNGGDWFELLVLDDHLDLRGWSITLEDRLGALSTLTFTDDPVLADLRSGTLFTVSEELPEDTAYDPERGDWRFQLRAGVEGTGTVISATELDVTELEWRLTLWDTEGHLRFGPAGEGVSPLDGISKREVGLLQDTPDAAIRRDSAAYGDSHESTFGSPNPGQDLDALRSVVTPLDADTAVYDTGAADTDGAADTSGASGGPGVKGPKAGGCGCGTGDAAGLGGALLALALALSRRRAAGLALMVACTGKGAVESGDTPATDSEPAPVDSEAGDPACYSDVDGDGYGDEGAPTSCEGGVRRGGDCDDGDPDVSPAAWEVCDGVDNDCDGQLDGEDPGLTDGMPFFPDADGDGYGSDADEVSACSAEDGLSWSAGDCDDADADVHPGADELCDEIDQDCDGVATDGLGSSAACAATSCLEILTDDPGAPSGTYALNLPEGGTAEIYCDMETDGGGWTLAMLRNSVSTGDQGDFGAGDVEAEQLDQTPEDASLSAEARQAWIDLNLYDWDTLRMASAYNGTETFLSEDIPRSQLRISFGEDGYRLYGGDSPYYWCGGDASYTDSGIGATDNPAGAPLDCKYHGSLGSGWDFSYYDTANAGLTLCGGDGSAIMLAYWGSTWVGYGTVGAAYALWVR